MNEYINDFKYTKAGAFNGDDGEDGGNNSKHISL